MSVLYALTWRLLHLLLTVQRALLAWLRLWHWRVWRAAGALLLPPDITYQERGPRDVSGRCSCVQSPDNTYLRQRCECAYLHRDLSAQQRDVLLRSRDRAKLHKLPIHIGLLIGEEQESYTDVASLVLWCMALGISYVSIFDPQGIFKQNSSRLMDEVLKQQKEECSKYPLEYANGSADRTDKAFRHLPVLKVLSPEDGKQNMVKAAQTFCQLVADKQKTPADLDVDAFDHLLRSTHNFPDPDLILKFGSINSTLGFLPWHIRLSEIISLPSHVNIQYEDFFYALCCYAGCEQRLGK
ncbi:dehydrodolichyl diphosphate synthase complex subunit NUS1 [Hyla sarda]|uniref:dehydrodolichyl diphosphate synthase complex subunit NUS1 n=1 Tax=Hyla sarda TaxID=327740 RepID=UPI0024C34280|nr:dehydrodolichyl diphosphate synthase complex subunit NUS1 [Hyla sarda]XP_056422397.1 dehydrodolichyl diphosphate synthase complex subunit NUS1 [Hyla sarda]XP_056422398.1 dehydrodolichyl diphosphate synthase complex subunit NUS1 [Hyla sarda]